MGTENIPILGQKPTSILAELLATLSFRKECPYFVDFLEFGYMQCHNHSFLGGINGFANGRDFIFASEAFNRE